MKQKSDTFLQAGSNFPDFDLPESGGKRYSRSFFLQRGPAALFAVFKAECPTSQFSLPYLNRLVEQIPRLPLVGISQDDPRETALFLQRWSTAFTSVLYEREPYPLSDALGLFNLPALFLVSTDGRILASDFGYTAAFWEVLAQQAGREFGVAVRPIVPADAPPWAAG